MLELLRKAVQDADVDFLREGLRVLVQAVMEAEVAAKTGAEHGERPARRPDKEAPGFLLHQAGKWNGDGVGIGASRRQLALAGGVK